MHQGFRSGRDRGIARNGARLVTSQPFSIHDKTSSASASLFFRVDEDGHYSFAVPL
jgi:hypothetical protein